MDMLLVSPPPPSRASSLQSVAQCSLARGAKTLQGCRWPFEASRINSTSLRYISARLRRLPVSSDLGREASERRNNKFEKERMTRTVFVLVALVALAGASVEAAAAAAAAESCHLREFDLCMTSAIVFVQQPQGTKVNEAEIEKQCSLFQETEECLESFTDRCMTPMQNSLVDFMSGGLLKYMRDYCKKGSDLRRVYLKHGECVQKQRKATNKCLVEFQAAIEKSTLDDTHWKDRPKVLCCALDRLAECNNKILEPACGKEALEVGNTLIQGTFSRAATLTCGKYKHKSAECQALLPPPDTKPKGSRSGSVMSKLISTITQV